MNVPTECELATIVFKLVRLIKPTALELEIY